MDEKLNKIHEQNERIIFLLESLLELMAEEDSEVLMDMDGNEYGLDRDDEGMLS